MFKMYDVGSKWTTGIFGFEDENGSGLITIDCVCVDTLLG